MYIIKSKFVEDLRHVITTDHSLHQHARKSNYRFWLGNLRERDYLKDSGVDGRIILRWIFWKRDVGLWTGSSWIRVGTDGGHL